MFRSQDIRIFVFWESYRFQNMCRHHRYFYIMEVTLMLISFES